MTITITKIPRICTKCGSDTGAEWKTLCRSCWDKRSPDEVRAYRQTKLDKKVARMRAKADRLQKEADIKCAVFDPYWGDTAFWTQPATPSSRFGRQRAKMYERYNKGLALHAEAQDLRKDAGWKEQAGIRVKGDAERERQQERDERDKVFTVGSKVYDWCFGDGVVKKVNKKTYTIQFTSGFTCTRDKSYIKL
jgi:hypothetical protein